MVCKIGTYYISLKLAEKKRKEKKEKEKEKVRGVPQSI